MDFDVRLREAMEVWGADLFGVADLSLAEEAIFAQGGALVSGFPRAISLGIVLMHSIVDQLPRRAERAVAINYRHHAYDVVNERLDQLASRIGSLLQREGYKALPIPAAVRTDDERIAAVFSHKLAAHLAGLGWIGKNCLLITPGAGPRVRWTTVLTDAPLKTGQPMTERCGSCRQCVEICPAKAITGRPFRPEEPRKVRLDAAKCQRYFEEVKTATGLATCGMCLYICPRGRKRR